MAKTPNAGGWFPMRPLLLLIAVVAAGYGVRFHAPCPEWLRDAGGGALYVVAWAVLLAGLSVRRPVLAALALTVALECLQWVQAPWLVALRHTLPGRLVLGTQFSWADFPPYLAGAALAWGLDRAGALGRFVRPRPTASATAPRPRSAWR